MYFYFHSKINKNSDILKLMNKEYTEAGNILAHNLFKLLLLLKLHFSHTFGSLRFSVIPFHIMVRGLHSSSHASSLGPILFMFHSAATRLPQMFWNCPEC